MLTDKQKEDLVQVYKDCENEQERNETVTEMAAHYNTTEMEIRQILQVERVYKKVEGKTTKEQYANALYAITGIPSKEWMKLTFKSQEKLMNIFKGEANA